MKSSILLTTVCLSVVFCNGAMAQQFLSREDGSRLAPADQNSLDGANLGTAPHLDVSNPQNDFVVQHLPSEPEWGGNSNILGIVADSSRPCDPGWLLVRLGDLLLCAHEFRAPK